MSFMLCGLPISNMTFRFVMQSQVLSEISILKADSSKFQRFQKFPGPWEQEMQSSGIIVPYFISCAEPVPLLSKCGQQSC